MEGSRPIVIFCVLVNSFGEQQLHHRLVPVLCSPRQRRPTVVVLRVDARPPFSSSSFTTASCPFSAAHDSGVRPYVVLGLQRRRPSRAAASPPPRARSRQPTTAASDHIVILRVDARAPFSSSSFTTASCPFLGSPRQRRPTISLSFESTLDAPFSSSSFTTASCPFSAAHDSGVRPDSVLGVDARRALLEQQLHHRLVPVPRQPTTAASDLSCPSSRRRRALLEQQLHHRLVPVLCSPRQRRPTICPSSPASAPFSSSSFTTASCPQYDAITIAEKHSE